MITWAVSTYINAKYYIAGIDDLENIKVKQSLDNINWVNCPTGLSSVGNPIDILWNGTNLLLVTRYGLAVSNSYGTTWNQVNLPGSSGSIYAACYASISNLFYIQRGNQIYSSPDGTTWTLVNTFSASMSILKSYIDPINHQDAFIVYAGYRIMYAGNLGSSILNDSTWSLNATYCDNITVMEYINNTNTTIGALMNENKIVSKSGTTALPSNWTAVNIDDTIYDITYGNGKYIAVGVDDNNNSKIYSSNNGTTWNLIPISSSNIDALFSVSYGPNGFVAAGTALDNNGKLFKSTDGITWVELDPVSGQTTDPRTPQDAPRTPTASVTSTTMTLESTSGSMIVCNNETKSSGSTWTGLTPKTAYAVYAYLPADSTHQQSPNSSTVYLATTGIKPATPIAPIASNITGSTITWTGASGTSITCNNETKVSGSTWTGLNANTDYTAIAFYPEHDQYIQSDNSPVATAHTGSTKMTTPSSPVASEITAHSIKWTSTDGAMIECNGEEKISGSTWYWLTQGVTYTAKAHMIGTNGWEDSDWSSIVNCRTSTNVTDTTGTVIGIMSDGTKAPSSSLIGMKLTASNDNVVIQDNKILFVKKGPCRITCTVGNKSTYTDINII